MSSTDIIAVVAIAVVFGILWWRGQIRQFALYVQEMREELNKCSWPSWIELRGSTTVIIITIIIIGGMTYLVDLLFTQIFQKIIF